jgi:ketosteroid isomerase-like protein
MGDPKIDTVQGIYEAFGRGDVPAILDVLTDDLDFGSEIESKIAPWHGLRRNKQQVAEFFQALAENVEVTEFTPLSFTSNDTDVMAVIRFGLTVPATGKSGAMDIHHWFRFDGDKVCFYRGTEDTALTADLLTP